MEASLSNCDPARQLRKILDLLVQANLHELDEDDSDEAYARKTDAETWLFALATDWYASEKKREEEQYGTK